MMTPPPKKKRPLCQEWANFKESIDPNESRERLIESAFYAGAQAMFIVIQQTDGPDTGPPSDGEMAMMKTLASELRDFCKRMRDNKD